MGGAAMIPFLHFLGYSILLFIAGAWWGIFWSKGD
jgi:hypothetical protein